MRVPGDGPVRIVFLLPEWGKKPRGGIRVAYRYANSLSRRGHDVTVVHGAFLEPRQFLGPLRLGRETRNLARGILDVATGKPDAVACEQLDSRVKAIYRPTLNARHVPDADVVVATSWRTAESAMRYAEEKGRRLYLIQHYETWDGPKRRIDATWRAPFTKVVIARWLAGVASGLGAGDTILIPNAIDTDEFKMLRPITSRPLRVAMLYSRAPIKGARIGIDALVEARTRVPELTAVLFGVRARPRGLPEWIEYRQNPPLDLLVAEVYNGSSIYLCPSLGEGWHLPPAEAMSCGCAVVSTDIDGVADYAEQCSTALLVQPGDARALAAAIERLARDDALRVALAMAGQQRIHELSWQVSEQRFDEVIAGLVS